MFSLRKFRETWAAITKRTGEMEEVEEAEPKKRIWVCLKCDKAQVTSDSGGGIFSTKQQPPWVLWGGPPDDARYLHVIYQKKSVDGFIVVLGERTCGRVVDSSEIDLLSTRAVEKEIHDEQIKAG